MFLSQLGLGVGHAVLQILSAKDKQAMFARTFGGLGTVGCTPSEVYHDEVVYSRISRDFNSKCVVHKWAKAAIRNCRRCVKCGMIDRTNRNIFQRLVH